MKLTKEILWNDDFLNKMTNLKTSFLIVLSQILVETRNIYRDLYDESWLNTHINNDCYTLLKQSDTCFSEDDIIVKNYFPIAISKTKFKKPVLRCSKYGDKKIFNDISINFEDGIKYILKHFFDDLKYNSLIEVFRIEIKNFISNKESDKRKNELIEKIFKYLSDRYIFASPIKYQIKGKTYCVESIYNIKTGTNSLNDTLALSFTISFKLCSEENDMPISFIHDSVDDFDIFYKKLKEDAKLFIKKQKNESRKKRKLNKYL